MLSSYISTSKKQELLTLSVSSKFPFYRKNFSDLLLPFYWQCFRKN